VRSAVFAARRHGYDEDAVDEVLDRVIEFLLQPGTENVLPSGPDPLEAPYLPAAGVAGATQPSLAQRLRDPAGPPADRGTDPEPPEPWSPFAPES
jgi:DivIVA domain-containing protein